MVELEIAYLLEIGKMSYPPNVVLEDLAPLDLSVAASPFSSSHQSGDRPALDAGPV